jgi:DNA replication protein DnaC
MPCPLCDDTGWKPVDENPSASSGQAVRRVVRCECWRDQIGKTRLADANIPKRYQHCTLENFLAYNDSLQRALESCRRVSDRFLNATSTDQHGRGILLEGPPGVGKTHLAVAVLKKVVAMFGARALFYDIRDLLKMIRSTYNPAIRTTEIEVLKPVMSADLLVLDDLGAEKTSEWVEETMNLIVNTRYNERRMTLFTSNYVDIPDDTDPNSLLFRIGSRMRSRLHEMCEFVVLDGADYRERPDNAGPDDLLALWKRRQMPDSPSSLPSPRGGRQARAQLKDQARDGRADLKWPGGRAGSQKG